MTNTEAIKLIQEIEEDGRNVTAEHIAALDLAVEALTYKAKIKKYGSELAMAYAEKAESDAYLKELNERHRKVFGKTLDDLMAKDGAK